MLNFQFAKPSQLDSQWKFRSNYNLLQVVFFQYTIK